MQGCKTESLISVFSIKQSASKYNFANFAYFFATSAFKLLHITCKALNSQNLLSQIPQISQMNAHFARISSSI